MELTNILLSALILVISAFGYLSYNSIVSSLDERFSSLGERFSSLDERLSSLDERLSSLDERLNSLDERFSSLDERFSSLNSSLLKEIHKIKDWGAEIAKVAQKYTLAINRVEDNAIAEASFFAITFPNNNTENIAFIFNYHTYNHSHFNKSYELLFGISSIDQIQIDKVSVKAVDCNLEFYPDYDTTLCIISKPSQIEYIKAYLGERILTMNSFKTNRARLGEKYGVVCNGHQETQYFRSGVVNSVNDRTFVIDADSHRGCSGSLVFNGEGITGMLSFLSFPSSLKTEIEDENDKGDIVTYPHLTKLTHIIHISSIKDFLLEISRTGLSQNQRKKIKLIIQEVK